MIDLNFQFESIEINLDFNFVDLNQEMVCQLTELIDII